MPMNALSPHDPCQEVICKFSSQTGKTEIILNFLGYIIDQDPGPTLAIQPNTKPMGEAFSKDRIAPMLRDTPVITDKVSAAKGRDSANTIGHKSFAGGHLTIGGANSPAGLASRPIRYLAFDEIDRYDVTKEGDAIALAQKRDKTFHNRKRLKTSSPTYSGVGIDAEYQSADQQFEWHLICPDCGDSQMPALRHFVWEKDWPETAVYTCEHCGTAHDFKQESRIKASGLWVETKNTGWLRKAFWMNQWASPFANWGETILEFLAAKDDPTKLQTVVNTAFAETWSESGEGIAADDLFDRREEYKELPGSVLVLVAGIDVQDDRLEAEIIGYGEGEESWGIAYKTIWGDPGLSETWERLDALLLAKYKHEQGHSLSIAATGIDSGGHFTKEVYDFCKTRFHRRVFCLKGVSGWGRPIVSAPSEKKYGRNPRPVKLFLVGVDEAKRVVHGRLKIEQPGPGYCHFPQTYTEEYFSMLGAEEIRIKYVKGVQRPYWHQTRARNESLDIRAYGLAVLNLLDPAWELLKLKTVQPEETEKEIEKTEKPVIRRVKAKAKKRGGYVQRWR